jgi:DNA helicase HerA-like ATPase
MTSFDISMILVIGIIFICFLFLLHLVTNFNGDWFRVEKKYKQHMKTEFLPEKKAPPEECIFVGTTGKRKVFLPCNAKHVYVCGTTGSGKTVALANFIDSGMKYEFPMLIIDGKGDTGKDSLLDVVQTLGESRKVYVIDLNRPETSYKYNPFCNTSSTVIKDMLINLSSWSEEHYKLNVERYLQRVIDLISLAEIPISFRTIVKYIEKNSFLMLSKDLVQQKKITKEQDIENKNLSKQSGDIAESAIARFSTLLESELGTIFADEGIDIYTALKENAIIMFVLNPLLYPELSPLFGNLVIIDSKKAISKLYSEEVKRRFFIFDEINVYASNSLLDLVNKSRSAGVTCVLASQSLSDLSASVSEHFKNQVIENCNNYIILRQNSPVNAEEWASIVGTYKTLDMTYQIEEGATTGKGSIRKVHEFSLHPDDIKKFETGKGYIVSKDKKISCPININKPF